MYAILQKASLCVLQVALIVATLPAERESAKPETVRGRIAAVSEKTIMVGAPAAQYAFSVSAKTKITLDMQPAKLTDLPVGSPVVVTAASLEKDAAALTIDAMTMKQNEDGRYARD